MKQPQVLQKIVTDVIECRPFLDDEGYKQKVIRATYFIIRVPLPSHGAHIVQGLISFSHYVPPVLLNEFVSDSRASAELMREAALSHVASWRETTNREDALE